MRKTRIIILITTSILIAIGIVMIYSASAIYAYERFNDSAYFLKRHLSFLAAGFLAAVAVMSIDWRLLKTHSRPILLLAVLLLVLVLVPGIGYEAGGAKRWFKFFNLSFQPSEFAKLAIIVYLADFLSRKQFCIKEFFSGFLPSAFMLGIVAGCVLLQPDLGTAVSIMAVGTILYFLAGTRLKHLGIAFLSALPVLYLMVFSVAYRRRRIMAFLNPWLDPRGVGFQIVQSFLALGSGGLLGVGLGKSHQKLFYLPASHTDFIFSIIGEELGLLGAMTILGLFIILVYSGLEVACRSGDLFGQFLALGLTSKIAFEAIVNIGVSIGLLPTKGLPLPFISYGGTALVFNIISVGILLNIARGRNARPVQPLISLFCPYQDKGK